MLLIAVFAPLLGTVDPTALAPAKRTREPSAEYWFGTDMLGRDIYSRVLYGARVSLTGRLLGGDPRLARRPRDRPGLGLRALGRRHRHAHHGRHDVDPADPARHRADGADARPACRTSSSPSPSPSSRASSRLVRGVVLSLREQPYVDAAIAAGTRTPMIILRHILPNTLAPHDRAGDLHLRQRHDRRGRSSPSSAPARRPIIPSWGNIMAEGRALWQVKPYIVFFPADLPLDHGAGGEPARRRPARRARPAHGQAALTRHAPARGREPADAFPHAGRRQPRRRRRLLPRRGRARRWPSWASRGCGKSVTAMSILRLIPEPPGKIAGSHPLQRPRPAEAVRRARCATSAATTSP